MISISLNIPINNEDKNPKIIIGKNILDKLFCKYLLEPRKIEASNAPIPADAVINDKLVLLPDKISPAIVGWISKTPLTNNALMKTMYKFIFIILFFKEYRKPSKKSFLKVSFLKEKISRFSNGIKKSINIIGKYNKAETRNVNCKSKYNIRKPAIAGPMTLEALNEAEFKPIALPKKDFFTTIETKTNLTG